MSAFSGFSGLKAPTSDAVNSGTAPFKGFSMKNSSNSLNTATIANLQGRNEMVPIIYRPLVRMGHNSQLSHDRVPDNGIFCSRSFSEIK